MMEPTFDVGTTHLGPHRISQHLCGSATHARLQTIQKRRLSHLARLKLKYVVVHDYWYRYCCWCLTQLQIRAVVFFAVVLMSIAVAISALLFHVELQQLTQCAIADGVLQ